MVLVCQESIKSAMHSECNGEAGSREDGSFPGHCRLGKIMYISVPVLKSNVT